MSSILTLPSITASGTAAQLNLLPSITASGIASQDTFPLGGVIPVGWVQPAGSAAAWGVATDSTFDGQNSIKSGAISHSQASAISYTSLVGAGTCSFALRVSSELNYDFLRFFIDGVQQGQWSGEVAWQTVTYTFSTPAVRTLSWQYSTDGSVFGGSNAAWIDSVVIPPAVNYSALSLPSIKAVGIAVNNDALFGSSIVTRAELYGTSAGTTQSSGSSTASLRLCTALSSAYETLVLLPQIVASSTAVTGSITNEIFPSLKIPAIIAVGQVFEAVVSKNTLLRIIAAAQGHTGTIGAAVLTLPSIKMTGLGYQPFIGTSSIYIPLIIAHATGHHSTRTSTTISMHAGRLAISEYTNYPFNSFAKFNGIYLGAGGAGLFALTGATDAGAFIAAAAKVGLNEFGTSQLKSVVSMYVGYRADGQMLLRVTTDEAATYDYPITSVSKPGIHPVRVNIGKGLRARYWQFEIKNVNGADFTLDAMEFTPVTLSRRIGA